jgi:hypothetical protein
MMTKIIISGVGSVIGLGCLVGAIVVGCKDKVCEESCKCKRKPLSTFDDTGTKAPNTQEQYDSLS